MKHVLTILRYAFVSLECLVSVAGLVIYIFCPGAFIWLSERIGQQAELLKWFGLLPVGLVVYDSTLLKAMLFPDGDKHGVLQSWKLYWNLKCGCVVGLCYGIVFAVTGITALLFDWKSPAAYQSAVLVTSVAGALTVSGTLFFSHIKVEELFRQSPTPTKSG